ncbi:hypothetical protein ADUPG1_012986 [Aduncisulcus paluster]|uniref:Uncharacterized protein n=1 Tax=Aduncisulcus paluster TaxID=2918883 RepID=A0ABQ5K1C3_9EUKA|nr:hypothetical protein ADUPG1_012986 [Aduncisulcus paluster]
MLLMMLKGEEYKREEGELEDGFLALSHLSIPFRSPSPIKGAYICVEKDDSSPSLLFSFIDCDGMTSIKYEFTRPKHEYEWHFLPIDLPSVSLCKIEGKGMWREKSSREFWINSLVFTMPEGFFPDNFIPIGKRRHYMFNM